MDEGFCWSVKTMINKELLKKRFSTNARNYDQYASVQKRMAHQLIHLLQKRKPQDQAEIHILEVGCGTGNLTEQVLNQFPQAHLTAVDLAPGMIEIAKERVKARRVQFYCGDIEEMQLNRNYDLILSNATFQWFNQPRSTIQYLYSLLNENGAIYFSTFGNRTFYELHTSFQHALHHLGLKGDHSPGQSFFSLNELIELCHQAARKWEGSEEWQVNGKECMEIERFHSVKDFFTSIRKIGANNSNQNEYCQRPSVFKEMIKIYESDFRQGNQIEATYHCLYLSIEKSKRDKG
ncbi:MAG TPA: malonyl-ACP O-methyltransferase BioC [Bacillota bacterium]|nr:malonyl-ACP O-methyltransferase BioC [Bacillota bacterium]